MKKHFYQSFLFIIAFPSVYSQVIQTSGFRGQFGIDAETPSCYAIYGTAPSPNNVDAWIHGEKGNGVMYTTNPSYDNSLPKNNKNIWGRKNLYRNVN